MHRKIIPVVCMFAIIALVAGCGGGGSEEAVSNTTTLEGTVYAEGVTTSQADGPQGQPVPDCPVEAVRARTHQHLGQTTTDEQGRYRFEGLNAGEDVEVRAHLQDGRQLMARTRIQQRTQEADVDADTTMSAVCARLMDEAPSTNPPEDVPVNETVRQVCEQYHNQHRFQYGNLDGTPPDFSDGEQTRQAAEQLLDEAAEDAIQKALQNRDQESCDRAVDMHAARMRHFDDVEMPWSEQARQTVSEALQRGWEGSPEDAAQAAEGAWGRQIAADNINRARERIQDTHPEFGGEAMNALEAAAITVMEGGSEDDSGGPPGGDPGDGADQDVTAQNPEEFEAYLDNLLTE